MNIAGLEYNLNHRALEIYVSGCRGPHCEGCHNQELWDFGYGEDYGKWRGRLIEKLERTNMVDMIWILGGEPQDQDMFSMASLIDWLARYKRPIVLFTKYESLHPMLENLGITYMKTGRYVADDESYVEPVLGLTLASRNQKVVKL